PALRVRPQPPVFVNTTGRPNDRGSPCPAPCRAGVPFALGGPPSTVCEPTALLADIVRQDAVAPRLRRLARRLRPMGPPTPSQPDHRIQPQYPSMLAAPTPRPLGQDRRAHPR